MNQTETTEDTNSLELYKKHRPASLKGVLGQEDAIASLHEMVKNKRVPHSILFTGPSGCGKTTLARILKSRLGCGDSDFTELNCADFRGIDMVREIRSRMGLAPIDGTCRIWLIDEAHQMSNPAQNAFLKILEDTPKHVYFFIATTDPQKLIRTIITRCSEVRVKSLGVPALRQLITGVAEREGVTVTEGVVDKIIESCEGSARMALVLLHKVIGLENEDKMIDAIEKNSYQAQGIQIARALIDPRAQWSDVAKLIKECDEDPEGIRLLILGYATSVLLGGGKLAHRAAIMIDEFSRNFYDSKKAGLAASSYAVVTSK